MSTWTFAHLPSSELLFFQPYRYNYSEFSVFLNSFLKILSYITFKQWCDSDLVLQETRKKKPKGENTQSHNKNITEETCFKSSIFRGLFSVQKLMETTCSKI